MPVFLNMFAMIRGPLGVHAMGTFMMSRFRLESLPKMATGLLMTEAKGAKGDIARSFDPLQARIENVANARQACPHYRTLSTGSNVAESHAMRNEL